VAVPRTHDGSVGPRSRTSGTTSLVAALAAVVAVACLVTLVVRFADTSGSTGDRLAAMYGAGNPDADAEAAGRERELVMSQASQFVLRVNTYGPDDLDDQNAMPDYVASVKEVITAKYAVEFDEAVTIPAQTVAQTQVERTAEIYATGVETIGADTAAVLVTGALMQSYPDTRPEAGEDDRIEEEPQQFRLLVRVVRTDGRWLVDDFEPVVGEVAGEETDPATPSEGAADVSGPVVRRFVEIVDNRRTGIETAVATLDSCGFPRAAGGDDPACAAAPQQLSAAARTLSASLRGAANPDAKVYVGEAPDQVAALADATRAAADNVVEAVGVLQADCITTDSEACSRQRTTLAGAQSTLLEAIDAWVGLG
jgi:Mce-associated membrane protein